MSAPRAVSKFFAKGKNGSKLKFRIQDLSEQLLPEAVDCYMNSYVKHDVLGKAAGVDKNNEALKEMRVLTHEMLAKPSPAVITVVCLHETDAQDSLVGICSAILKCNNDELQDLQDLLTKLKTKEMRKLAEIYMDMAAMYDLLAENPHVGAYYDDRGVAVLPGYRGAGLADQLVNLQYVSAARWTDDLKKVSGSGWMRRAEDRVWWRALGEAYIQQWMNIRLSLCQQITKVSAGWMTSTFTQNFFQRQGFTTGCEISFQELGRRHGVTFQGTPPTAKRMFGVYQLKDDIKLF